MAIRTIGLTESDKEINEEISSNLVKNQELSEFIKKIKQNKTLLKAKDLVDLKIRASMFTYENISYYIFVMAQKNEITEDELELLVKIIKKAYKEGEIESESDMLSNHISEAIKTLEGVDLEQFVGGAYANIREESLLDAYVYSRALFDYDVIVLE